MAPSKDENLLEHKLGSCQISPLQRLRICYCHWHEQESALVCINLVVSWMQEATQSLVECKFSYLARARICINLNLNWTCAKSWRCQRRKSACTARKFSPQPTTKICNKLMQQCQLIQIFAICEDENRPAVLILALVKGKNVQKLKFGMCKISPCQGRESAHRVDSLCWHMQDYTHAYSCPWQWN